MLDTASSCHVKVVMLEAFGNDGVCSVGLVLSCCSEAFQGIDKLMGVLYRADKFINVSTTS